MNSGRYRHFLHPPYLCNGENVPGRTERIRRRGTKKFRGVEVGLGGRETHGGGGGDKIHRWGDRGMQRGGTENHPSKIGIIQDT